jgi:hypothetical protein
MKTKRYEPVGFCIYCGAQDNLTDEHVIPFGLNGNIILPQASCQECNKITSRFERRVLKEDLKDLRAGLSFNTRRPQNIPKNVPLLVTTAGRENTVQVPPAESMLALILPSFDPPGYPLGRESKTGIHLRGFVHIQFGAHPQELLNRHSVEKVGTWKRVDAAAFARMLAKIAYCTVVAELGFDAIARNYVLPAIRGDSDDLGSWIGTIDNLTPPTPADVQHSVIFGIMEKGDEHLLYAGVKLFSNTQAPAYLVILGRAAKGLVIKGA